ncbi:hypothetical protein X781_9540 [Mannheimia sp. USDA-ARS-USMARC-1261]|nr:hypothetical protein X781_9540 [Mannheimia sp. USDA-ARS-USMARC-1261]
MLSVSVSALVVFGWFVCFLLHHNFSCWVHRVITGRLPKKQVRIGPVRMTVFFRLPANTDAV